MMAACGLLEAAGNTAQNTTNCAVSADSLAKRLASLYKIKGNVPLIVHYLFGQSNWATVITSELVQQFAQSPNSQLSDDRAQQDLLEELCYATGYRLQYGPQRIRQFIQSYEGLWPEFCPSRSTIDPPDIGQLIGSSDFSPLFLLYDVFIEECVRLLEIAIRNSDKILAYVRENNVTIGEAIVALKLFGESFYIISSQELSNGGIHMLHVFLSSILQMKYRKPPPISMCILKDALRQCSTDEYRLLYALLVRFDKMLSRQEDPIVQQLRCNPPQPSERAALQSEVSTVKSVMAHIVASASYAEQHDTSCLSQANVDFQAVGSSKSRWKDPGERCGWAS
jgi:hypothetical protein